jgi:hypothetical protein
MVAIARLNANAQVADAKAVVTVRTLLLQKDRRRKSKYRIEPAA